MNIEHLIELEAAEGAALRIQGTDTIIPHEKQEHYGRLFLQDGRIEIEANPETNAFWPHQHTTRNGKSGRYVSVYHIEGEGVEEALEARRGSA